MVKEMQKDVNVLLLKQQIPFMLNVSHYMTDLVYTLYYTIKLQDDDDDDAAKQRHILELEGRKTLLSDEIYKLREQFRNLLNQSSGSIYGMVEEDNQVIDEDNNTSQDILRLIQQFKDLIDEELLQTVRDTNILLITELSKQIPERSTVNIHKLNIQLDNCLYGFLNLVTFIRKIPLRVDNKESMESIVNVIKDELLLSWKIELDLLNCKIFNLISKNEKIIKLFQQYRSSLSSATESGTMGEQSDSSIPIIKEDSKTFIELISWLKDEQVFGSIAL